MRHATIVGIFTVILTLITGLVFAEQVIDDSKEPSYMYVLSATSGSLKGDTLTLNGVPSVIYFSDRPARMAGHLSLEKFVESWNMRSDSFKADPPNATLSILDKDNEMNVVVDLISVQQKNSSLIFNVTVHEGSHPKLFNSSALFMDESPPPIYGWWECRTRHGIYRCERRHGHDPR